MSTCLITAFFLPLFAADEVVLTKVSSYGSGYSQDTVIEGNTAFVASGVWGLEVLDISDPGNIQRIAHLYLGRSIQTLYKHGNHLFANSGSQLLFIDVSDASQPREAGALALGGYSRHFSIRENRLFVSYGPFSSNQIAIYDISDLSQPNLLSQWAAGQVRFVGSPGPGLLCVADMEEGFLVWDISNEAQPVQLSALPGLTSPTKGGTLDEEHVVLAEFNQLYVVDITNPANPTVCQQLPLTAFPRKISVEAGRVTVFHSTGIDSYNLTQPCSGGRDITSAGDHSFVGGQVRGMTAYGAANEYGFRVIDLSTSNEIGIYDHSFHPSGLLVRDDVLMTCDQRLGLQCFDLSNPYNPQYNKTVAFDAEPLGITASGSFAYLTSVAPYQLEVLDISNPANPTPLASSPLSTFFEFAKVEGNRLYAYKPFEQMLTAVDVSQPGSAVELGTLNVPDVRDMVVKDGFLYVAEGENGLLVIDADNPTDMKTVATFNLPLASAVAIQGNHVLVATNTGVQWIDAGDPQNPFLSGDFQTTGSVANAIKLSGDHLYIGDTDSMLKVFDITVPHALELVGSAATTTRSTYEISPGDGVVYLIGDGLDTFAINCATQETLMNAYPLWGTEHTVINLLKRFPCE